MKGERRRVKRKRILHSRWETGKTKEVVGDRRRLRANLRYKWFERAVDFPFPVTASARLGLHRQTLTI